MRRTVLLLVALLLVPASTAEAKEKNQRPRVRIGTIVETGPGEDGTTQFTIPIHAVDPDGVISELVLDFGDGVVLFMLMFCDPETTRPGDPITQEVTWSYAPGTYKLRALGYSTPECFEGEFQESKRDSAHLRVR